MKGYKCWNLEDLKNTKECVFPPNLSQYLSEEIPHKDTFLNGSNKANYPRVIDISS